MAILPGGIASGTNFNAISVNDSAATYTADAEL
jgi:hypothetical protein